MHEPGSNDSKNGQTPVHITMKNHACGRLLPNHFRLHVRVKPTKHLEFPFRELIL